jgi:hypothetical protein
LKDTKYGRSRDRNCGTSSVPLNVVDVGRCLVALERRMRKFMIMFHEVVWERCYCRYMKPQTIGSLIV